MTILHSGTTKQYSTNWAQAFGQPKAAAKSDAKKMAAKKAAPKKKKTGKK